MRVPPSHQPHSPLLLVNIVQHQGPRTMKGSFTPSHTDLLEKSPVTLPRLVDDVVPCVASYDVETRPVASCNNTFGVSGQVVALSGCPCRHHCKLMEIVRMDYNGSLTAARRRAKQQSLGVLKILVHPTMLSPCDSAPPHSSLSWFKTSWQVSQFLVSGSGFRKKYRRPISLSDVIWSISSGTLIQ
jgi:hypothetical protein